MAVMKIVTTGPVGIPGAVGLEFGRGLATDADGYEHEVFNPMPYPIPPSIAVVAGRVHVGRWGGEAWCVLTLGCHTDRAAHPAPAEPG